MTPRGAGTVNRWLAGMAGMLGVLALLAGSLQSGAVGLAEIEITAPELAEWMRDRTVAAVIDLRTASSYDDYHVPLAAHREVETLGDLAVAWDARVVVYGDDRAAGLAGWHALRRAGFTDVHVLSDGVGGWLRDIVSPVLPSDASPAAREAFERLAEISRYFGGTPRVGEPNEDPTVTGLLTRARRRSCEF